MHSDGCALEIANKQICQAALRVAELEKVLDNLAKRDQPTEFTASLVKTFEEDLAVSRAKLARLKT
jgi:hypothetical protein